MVFIRLFVKGGKCFNNIDIMGVKEFVDDLKGYFLIVSFVMFDILVWLKDGFKIGFFK